MDDSVTGAARRSSGGAAAELGLVAGGEPGDVGADAAIVVGEPGECLVDEVEWRGLTAPGQEELDRLVRHLADGVGRVPGEGVGGDGLGLAAEDPVELVLGDEQLLVTQPLPEHLEALGDRDHEVVDEVGVEHDG